MNEYDNDQKVQLCEWFYRNQKVYIPRLLNAMNEYDNDQKVQFCEWFRRSVLKDTEFVNKAVWSYEA